jgi:uncharacterized protein YdhG (YjbR/CyaY superfamily)
MKTDLRPAKTVDEYLDRLPEDVREILEDLRQLILSVAPGAEELISYQMPGYKLNGPLVYFAAFKDHCSFFPGKKIAGEYADELSAFKVSGGTIQFTVAKPLPASIVKKIVKRRVKENNEKASLKKKKKSKE